jgi:hypothetical protein
MINTCNVFRSYPRRIVILFIKRHPQMSYRNKSVRKEARNFNMHPLNIQILNENYFIRYNFFLN